MMSQRLLLVSNRLPVTIKFEKQVLSIQQSVGGLATGLSRIHETMDALWIGWPGDTSSLSQEELQEVNLRLQQLNLVPIHLSSRQIDRFYEGFSNGVLWPLFHYLMDKVRLDAWKDWKAYQDVNRRFAEAIVAQYRAGDLIWIQDYQLLLVPQMLREALPQARIGLFLHIPFPSEEVFRILPWRESLLEGMLGANLVGFHTESYLKHFRESLEYLLKLDPDSNRVLYQDREIRLGSYPIGIAAEDWNQLSQTPAIEEEAQKIKAECGERQLLLAVDRLDYTKGIPRRLLAMERFFELYPSWRNKVRLIQVAVPSRTKVEAYESFRRQIDEMVGRINGLFTTFGAVPIHYLYRSLPSEQLMALYRAANVMLVTPLRDGMNLVAKEFIACRNDEDGVLVLSEFAGAAEELQEAIPVNPYDVDQMAKTLLIALSLPLRERQRKMAALRMRVFRQNIQYWASSFLADLQEANQTVSSPHTWPSSAGALSRCLQKIRRAPQLILLLDYDGTLVEFQPRPEDAIPDPELRALLLRLAERAGTQVHLVSGRSRYDLEEWFGQFPIGLHAEHGFCSRDRVGQTWKNLWFTSDEWKVQVRLLLEQFLAKTPGALIEEKPSSLVWHYRMVFTELGSMQTKTLRLLLQTFLASETGLEILEGDKFLEVRPRGAHKGMVAQYLAATHPHSLMVALGDDLTDESLFMALPHESLSLHVGSKPSMAQYRLAHPTAVRHFLQRILD